MRAKAIFYSAVLLFILAACSPRASAQTGEQQLTSTILHLDSAFWKAYNTCDTMGFNKFFTNDIEFYHDKGGITIGAQAFIASLSKNLCGTINYRLRREAVAGSVKVYPMRNGNELYGAIITGDHLFYINEDGKPEFADGAASFTHLWIIKDGEWKMKRVLSFNHHPAEYINTRKEIMVPKAQLDQLAGTYKSTKSGSMDLVRQGSVLLLKAGNNSYTLYPQSATTFFTKERDLVFEIIKGADNKPAKMIVNEHGAVADELMFEK